MAWLYSTNVIILMSNTYQTTGINLKATPIGEADRLLTILTAEHGLIRVIAPGARKPKSSLGGRSGIFVINQLLIVRGKSIDRITQAETMRTYRNLSTDLSKLSISQYWAEILLGQAISDQPQPELYEIFQVHLGRLNSLPQPGEEVLAYLCQGIFHLLAVGGIAPQVHNCCYSGKTLTANLVEPRWKVGFSNDAGGAVDPTVLLDKAQSGLYYLTGLELALFQQLSAPDLGSWTASNLPPPVLEQAWSKIEKVLRQYIRHHLGVSIRSADLLMVGRT
jgi:DNA repair protein RecO (recombination protein O)